MLRTRTSSCGCFISSWLEIRDSRWNMSETNHSLMSILMVKQQIKVKFKFQPIEYPSPHPPLPSWMSLIDSLNWFNLVYAPTVRLKLRDLHHVISHEFTVRAHTLYKYLFQAESYWKMCVLDKCQFDPVLEESFLTLSLLSSLLRAALVLMASGSR